MTPGQRAWRLGIACVAGVVLVVIAGLLVQHLLTSPPT